MDPSTAPRLGTLTWTPAAERPDLLAAPVAAALGALTAPAWVAEIDAELADTAAFTEAYGVPLEVSANCVVVAARRAGQCRTSGDPAARRDDPATGAGSSPWTPRPLPGSER